MSIGLNAGQDDEIVRAIMFGAAAGACRYWARIDPKVRSGMTKAADSYSDRAAEMVRAWADRQ